MNNTIYIKGDAGFKSAILTKLGNWLHGSEDCGEDMLGFSIPEDILLEDFKGMIGYDNVVAYNLQFLDKILEESLSEIPPKFVPGSPIKMSIWANKDYNNK